MRAHLLLNNMFTAIQSSPLEARRIKKADRPYGVFVEAISHDERFGLFHRGASSLENSIALFSRACKKARDLSSSAIVGTHSAWLTTLLPSYRRNSQVRTARPWMVVIALLEESDCSMILNHFCASSPAYRVQE
jgi:hypothetical protein